MSDQSPRRLDVSRRKLLNLFVASAATGLAGCSGLGNGSGNGSTPVDTEERPEDTPVDEDTPEDTPTPEPEVEHVPTGQLAEEWVQRSSADSQGQYVLFFDSYSPSQLAEKTGTTLESMSLAERVYSRISGLNPSEIPESFHQISPNFGTLKVDQLPGGVSREDVVEGLQSESDYGKVTSIGDFDLYSSGGNRSVHALSDDRMVSALEMFRDVNGYSAQDKLQHLRDSLRSYQNGETGISEDLQDLQETLGLRDTFGAMNTIGLDGHYLVSGLDEEMQPKYGAVSIDVEEGRKYAGWLFDNAETAQSVREALEEGAEARNGYANPRVEGKVLIAEGEANLEQNLEEEESAGQGMLCSPQI